MARDVDRGEGGAPGWAEARIEAAELDQLERSLDRCIEPRSLAALLDGQPV